MLNKMEPRDVLRTALDARDEKKRAVEVAGTALARATDLLRGAETRLATVFADVDTVIATHHANAVKAWAGSGGEKPSTDVPKRLIDRRKARDETVAEADAARSACKALSDDLDVAKVVLVEAERSASEAALSVMLKEAERVAAFLQATKREVWRLASQISGLGEVWLPTGPNQSPEPVRLPQPVLAALTAQEPQYPPTMRPEAKQSAAWRSFHAALLADHETTFEGAP